MEDMRSKFITLCEQKEFVIDRTCIKQDKEDRDCGVMVGYKDKEIVVATPWFRNIKESDGKRYYYMQTATICHKYDYLLEPIQYVNIGQVQPYFLFGGPGYETDEDRKSNPTAICRRTQTGTCDLQDIPYGLYKGRTKNDRDSKRQPQRPCWFLFRAWH